MKRDFAESKRPSKSTTWQGFARRLGIPISRNNLAAILSAQESSHRRRERQRICRLNNGKASDILLRARCIQENVDWVQVVRLDSHTRDIAGEGDGAAQAFDQRV